MDIASEMGLDQRVGVIEKTELGHFPMTDPDEMQPVVFEGLVGPF